MSQTTSPTRFASEYDSLMYDTNFTADISQKMRVPKRIKVNGDTDDENMSNMNGWAHEKFDMHVPDRILVVGQEQHLGTRAPPRELVLENAVLGQRDNHLGFTRVQTPPRIITLDDHYFPSADDFEGRANELASEKAALAKHNKQRANVNLEQSFLSNRENTPPLSNDFIGASEEVVHLRRQLAKLNRRVMTIEIDNLQRQQREKVLYALGLAYLLLKTVFWLNRST